MTKYSDNVEVVEMAHAPDNRDLNAHGPGQVLRNARYALRKSEKEVAVQFNLSKEHVIALENDDYDKLPGVVFIRGYLRAYARAVNLPGDEIIAQFNATAYASQAKQSQQVISGTLMERGNHRDKRVRWIAYGIIGLFLVLVALWWNSQTALEGSNIAKLSTGIQQNDNVVSVPQPLEQAQ